jgi:hypothetical protein
LERLVLWPTFTGAEWELPTQVPGAERLLIGWRWAPESVDGGPPPAVAKLVATALTRHGPLTFASATRPFAGGPFFRPRLRENFVWATSADADEATQGVFGGDAFNWDLRGQVAILGTPGVPLILDERFLQLPSDSRLFAELPSLSAKGVLLPGVDGAVASLYFLDPNVGGAVQKELEDLTRAAGGQCVVVAQRETFAAELRRVM